MDDDMMILGKDCYYSMDSYKTFLNNNVLVVGASGAGKTRSIVTPNLLQASGSYIISDPKGNLHRKYGDYLKSKGYVVKCLNFTDPSQSCHYNFFHYIKGTQDVLKAAHMLAFSDETTFHSDPFWDLSSQLLLQAIIAYILENHDEMTLRRISELIDMFKVDENIPTAKSKLDLIFDLREKECPESYAVKMYKKFRAAAGKTLKSIIITLNSKIGLFDTPELNKMMETDDLDIPSIGQRKTALFVIISDTDRSMDIMANLFFTQAMNELCRYADNECEDYRLPVPVRFILDDFATNCKIDDFPRMIASIRSRGISTMLIIQAESQLKNSYDNDAPTIIGNCDTYVYLGGNDVETAKAISERCDVPLKSILNMPVRRVWIFRRGSAPFFTHTFDLESFESMKRAILLEEEPAI